MKAKIEEILKMKEDKSGIFIDFDGLLVEKKTKTKDNGDKYLNVTLQDNTGKIDFPIWEDYDKVNNAIKEEVAYTIKGKLNFWNGTVQVKNPKVFLFSEGDNIDMDLFVPTYDVPKEIYEYFENTVAGMEHPYCVIAQAATGCANYNKERWEAFTTCVSAEKHHGNKRKGLLLHTVGLMKIAESTITNYITNPYFYDASKVINPSRLMLKIILHDIAKPKEYDYAGVIRYKPNKKINHLIEGVAYLKEINKECGNILSEEDVENIGYSILSHHGQWGPEEPKEAEDYIVHLADMIDSRIVGAIEK